MATAARISSDPNPPNLRGPIAYTPASAWGANLNREGVAERLSDVLLFDNGAAPNCFTTGNVLSVAYGAPITAGPGLDVFDSASSGGLAVTLQISAPSTVRITVTAAGTAGNLTAGAVGSAVRVRGVRADVSGVSAGLNVTVSAAGSAAGTLAPTLKNVGAVFSTIGGGAGITTAGSGAQNANATLSKHAVFSFGEGFAGAFRVGGTNVAGVVGDGASGATSLVLDASNTVPLGVTVTFPAAIVSGGLTLALRSGGTCSGPAPCYAIYDTQQNSGSGGTVTVTTLASARTGADGSTPAIGVKIAAVSATGAVTLRAVFGPGVSGTGNDDVNPAAVPRYAGTRSIFSGTWFVVAPTVVTAALSRTSVDFAATAVGLGSAETIILTNTGTLALQLGGMQLSGGDFAEHDNCGTMLAGMASCLITVDFTPQTAGWQAATLTIQSNAVGSPFVVQLNGQGQVINPVPTVTSLAPGGSQAGISILRLVVRGTRFVAGAQVLWNGAARGTTFVSSTELDAGIVAADLATPGTAAVSARNPEPGGGVSNALNFTIGEGPIPAAAYLYYVPHVVSGGGFCTKITVVDLSGKANSVTLNYVGQDGSLLESQSHALAAGGTLRVETDDAEQFGAPNTRWAVVGTEGKATVQAMFETRQAPDQEQVTNTVGFADSTPLSEFTLPVEFAPRPPGVQAGRTVGLAVANPNGATSTLTLQLMDGSGTVVGTYAIVLPPFGQTAVDLQTVPVIQRALPAGSFVGSLAGSATLPLCVIALEDNYGPFASLAPVSGRAK